METLNLNLGGQALQLLVSREGVEPLVALKPLCEAVGLDWKTQLRRTSGNPQFRCGLMTIPSAGGPQQTLCLPVCEIGMWLCTINANRVREDIKSKLLEFQRHLQVVIHEHLSGRLTTQVIEQLQKTVAILQDHVAQLTFKLIDMQEDNQEMRAELRAHSILDKTLISNAGRQLAAQKAAKKAIN
jgi:uncharacterized coiled-coil protein SlyX